MGGDRKGKGWRGSVGGRLVLGQWLGVVRGRNGDI